MALRGVSIASVSSSLSSLSSSLSNVLSGMSYSLKICLLGSFTIRYFPSFCCMMMSSTHLTMPQALSMFKLICWPNSMGLNCWVPRMMCLELSLTLFLGTQQFKPIEFGQQINLNMDNAWGIVRCVLDIIMQQKDGKYLIVKDPNKQILRLYDIPDNTFESEDDSEESEEDTDAIDTPLRA